jgi:hypothetical protein
MSSIFSQDAFIKDSIPKQATQSSIGFVDLFAGGAFGYVDGFAAGASINALYSNILLSLGYVMNNEQGGLEYVEEDIIPINYYMHYRIDNFPLMVGFYRPFRGASLSASAGCSLLFYTEYINVNTFSIFDSNPTEVYSTTNLGFPYEFNVKLFNKNEGAVLAYGLKLFGNLGKYNYTGLALVLSFGSFK